MPTDSGDLAVGAHAFTTSTNATLTYFVTGTGPLVLVNVAPGWGCASGLYHNSFGQEIYDAFTFVHLEYRGTHGSSFPEDMAQMSSWHMAEDVEHLREHLGLEQVDVLDHSNGGVIALWYAIRFPTRVRRLVLMCSNLVTSMKRRAARAGGLPHAPTLNAAERKLNLVQDVRTCSTTKDSRSY
ncbi:alpha/beta-hydrolase [Exidia glandulosa HHB12029]|uniref:Alpha/beta-hydrolase n=1 Tax=Exidia glandulosa HHB12029 TaxID=1314781 RepID=A0A165GY31_EXIGL|nr:alpha/beta-hydrolase [Exidia glandulosa HHB12029]